jgi:hypothetical protein
VGALSLLFRGFIPVEWISDSSEKLVGVLLIGIGAWALRKALQIHSHEHHHDGEKHEHIHLHGHGHSASEENHHHHAENHLHSHAAFGIGTLHGLAGSSHFLGVLPALALPSHGQAAVYLLAYAVGTVLAMMLFSEIIGRLAVRLQIATWKAYRGLMAACSLTAFAVGVFWLTGNSF